MGTLLRRVKKEYEEEIVRNQTLFDLLDELEELNEKLNDKLCLRIKRHEEDGQVEFIFGEFLDWYENNNNEKSYGMKELYNCIKNKKIDRYDFISFKWF